MGLFNEEKKLWRKGFKRVACLDEAGRGPLAGPVLACAVFILHRSEPDKSIKELSLKIKDSKKLSPKKREELFKVLTCNPNIKWAIGRVSEKAIDKINILEATKLAMQKALRNLEIKLEKKQPSSISYGRRKRTIVDFLILDGKMKLDLPISQKSIVKADEKVFSCAAASIIAKVARDRIMVRYHKKYPNYFFNEHKGYPTKKHKRAVKKLGPCKIHRLTFKPVRKCYNKITFRL